MQDTLPSEQERHLLPPYTVSLFNACSLVELVAEIKRTIYSYAVLRVH
jgi:hypothetical protein